MSIRKNLTLAGVRGMVEDAFRPDIRVHLTKAGLIARLEDTSVLGTAFLTSNVKCYLMLRSYDDEDVQRLLARFGICVMVASLVPE